MGKIIQHSSTYKNYHVFLISHSCQLFKRKPFKFPTRKQLNKIHNAQSRKKLNTIKKCTYFSCSSLAFSVDFKSLLSRVFFLETYYSTILGELENIQDIYIRKHTDKKKLYCGHIQILYLLMMLCFQPTDIFVEVFISTVYQVRL